MGAHSSAHDLMAGVESDAIRVKAAACAVILEAWLHTPPGENGGADIYRLLSNGPERGNTLYPSDVIEVLRSARDVLEAIGRG